MKIPQKQPSTRVEILVEKGIEELLPEELYSEFLPSGIWIEERPDGVIINAYPADVEGYIDALHTSGINPEEVIVVEEEQKDYAELTKQYFRPIKVDGISILPPWSKRKRNGKYIIIEPGMAFGTGRHESTRTMFKLMKTVHMEGKDVLDLGCGSGILSLYAHLLGAKKIAAIDNHLDTVISAKKNIDLNGAQNIDLACADLQDMKGTYDVILANLDIQTFTLYAEHIKGLLREGGSIIISGILTRNRKDALSLFNPFTLLQAEKKNSWCGFTLQKGL
jgi:ribosomal protein L11 methyltransferase